MIFSKETGKCCAYCEHSVAICKSDTVMCAKKGIVRVDGICRKFVYSPFKRTPAPLPVQKETFAKEDFEI